jgi:hypothetical protein
MSARGDADPLATVTGAMALPPVPLALPVALDPDVEIGNNLPSDHPAWTKGALSLSQRAGVKTIQIEDIIRLNAGKDGN